MRNVKITVSGPAGSGKSTIIAIIASALSDAGVAYSVPKNNRRIDSKSLVIDDLSVEIEEEQSSRWPSWGDVESKIKYFKSEPKRMEKRSIDALRRVLDRKKDDDRLSVPVSKMRELLSHVDSLEGGDNV